MADNREMLVVDDEEVVCQVCKRIFSRQGFHVDAHTDARQGLALALEKDYEIILLDIKMPNMDGIEFLERLRQKKHDAAVLIITGYPSIPNAASAMRLGACDYVTKPFTSEEITWAVQRVLGTGRDTFTEGKPAGGPSGKEAEAETLFWDEAWLRQDIEGWACAGAVLPGLRGVKPTSVKLPRIGEVLYQGLPLAGITVPNRPMIIVPSPVSGVVVAVNEDLPQHLNWLIDDPCGDGCLACLSMTRHEELTRCTRRRILLVNADTNTAQVQEHQLAELGCQTQQATDRDAVVAALRDTDGRAVFLDAASLGDAGPAMAGAINERAPNARIVVVGASGDSREPAYRKHRIFYYAVEPFADNEIADILTAVFRTTESLPKIERHREPSEPISAISITNRNGHKIQLLSAPGLLWRNEGLGQQIGEKLLAKMFPVVITPGEAHLTPGNILSTVAACDRVMVLLTRDGGLLPGSLVRNTKPEFGVEPGEAAGKVTTMAVQPDLLGGFACLDARTIATLADHIVWDMASY